MDPRFIPKEPIAILQNDGCSNFSPSVAGDIFLSDTGGKKQTLKEEQQSSSSLKTHQLFPKVRLIFLPEVNMT